MRTESDSGDRSVPQAFYVNGDDKRQVADGQVGRYIDGWVDRH